MAEWKLTNKAISEESQWKPTGKTYEQMPNKPQKEESMFPSVDELAKANIKADQLKQVIPSRTYDPSFQYSSKINPAILKLTKGEALNDTDISEIVNTAKTASSDTKLTENDRGYFKSLSDTLAKYSEDKNTAYVDFKNSTEKYKTAKSSDRTALEKALDFVYDGMKADDNYSQEEKKLRDAAVKYYAYEGITSEEKAKGVIKDLKQQNTILKRQNENGSLSKEENKKNKQTIKENEEKISSLNVMVYGKDPDLWDTIQLAAQSIPANILSSISSTGDAIVNTAAKWLGAKGDIVNTRQTMKGVADDINASIAQNTAAMGDKFNVSGNLINAVSSTLPSAVISIAATAATGGAAAPSVLAPGSSSFASLMSNPALYTSFVMTYGNEYYDFIERGADPNIAFAAALTSAAINSFIEIGGGVETLPGQLALAPTGKKKFLEWFVSSLEEGGEELLQGAISEIFARIATGDFKTTTEEFAQFAKQGLYEGAMGVAGGAFLGGGQFAFNEIVNYNSNKQYSDLGQYIKKLNNGSEFQNVIDYARTSDNQTMRSLVANPEQITNTAAGMAYSYMLKDINTAITSQQTIQAATNGLEVIISQNGIASPIVSGIAVPQYVETVLRLDGTTDDAMNGIAKAAEIDTTTSELNGQDLDKSTQTNEQIADTTNILPAETAEPKINEPLAKDLIESTSSDILAEKTAAEKHIVNLAKKIDKNLKVVMVDKIHNEKGQEKAANGKFVRSENTLYIKKGLSTAAMYIEIFKHELMHRLESRKLYDGFKDYLLNNSVAFEQYVKTELSITNKELFNGTKGEALEALKQWYVKQGYSYAETESEIVADFFAEVLFKGSKYRSDIVNALANENVIPTTDFESTMNALEELAQKDRNLFQKIVDFIKELIAKFKGYPQANSVISDLEFLEKYMERLARSKDIKKRVSDSSEQFSIPSQTDAEYLELAKDPEKNKARLQEMVDEAAKKWGAYQIDGKPHIFYHTTDYDFTVFKKGEKGGLSGKGIYFGYNRMPYGKRTIAAYLKMENPMTYQETYEIDGVRETANRIKMKIIPDVYEKFPQFDGIIGRDEVTVKDASQIKSADPVTYDNNGNVIPLSERFNSGNEDIRFSFGSPSQQLRKKRVSDSSEQFSIPSQTDAEYLELAKDPEKNKARLQEMVNEAAEKTMPNTKAISDGGKIVKVFHGTADSFTVFDKKQGGRNTEAGSAKLALFFTNDKKIAEGYAKIARPKFIDELRIRAERLDNRAAFSGLGSDWTKAEEAQAEYETAEISYDGEGNVLPLYLNISNPLIYDFKGEEYREVTFAELLKKAMSEGKDGAIFKNTHDSATHDYDPITDIYVAFSPNQIKSADPVTYDDNGNVIPLSERFDSRNEDIRYSTGSPSQQLRYNPERYGEWLKRRYNSSADIESLTEKLTEAVKQYNKFKYDEANDIINEVAVEISDAVKLPVNEWSQELIDYVKSLTVRLDDVQKAEIISRLGSIAKFKKETGINVSDDSNTSLDSMWQEMVETYPGWFDEETNSVDMPVALAEIVENARNDIIDYDYDYVAREISNQIKNTLDTTGKRAEQKRISEAKQEAFIKGFKQSPAQQKTLSAKFGRNVNHLDSLMVANENQRHIPDNMQDVVKKFLKIFMATDPKSIFTYGKNLAKRNALYLNNGKDFKYSDLVSDFASAFDRFVKENDLTDNDGAETIRDMIKEMSDYPIGLGSFRLSNSQIEVLAAISEYLNNQANGKNDVFLQNKKYELSELGERVLKDLESRKVTLGAMKSRELETIRELFYEGNITPYSLFQRLGGLFPEIYDDLIESQNTMIRNRDKSGERFTSIKSSNNYQKWKDDSFDISLKGKTYHLTVEQAMQIYATAKREESNKSQGARHTKFGGVVLDTTAIEKSIDSLRKVNNESKSAIDEIKKAMRGIRSRSVKLSDMDIKAITSKLTSEQIKYADDIVEMLSTWGAKLGNEVTLKLYNFRKYFESYYFPYVTASFYRAFNIKGTNQGIMKSPGFSKSLTDYAGNPILISGFTDVAAKHIDGMINYNAFAVTLDTLNNVLNYGVSATEETDAMSVWATLEGVFGSGMTDTLKNFVRDTNNGIVQEQKYRGVGKLISVFRKTAVGASLTVWIQQAPAIIRATQLMDFKYLLKAKVKITTANKAELTKEMKKNVPIASLKSRGTFGGMGNTHSLDWIKGEDDTTTDKFKKFFSVKDSSVRDDVFGYMSQKGDESAWRALYVAVKLEISDTTELKEGTKEFNEAVRKRFTDLIVRTQVYDSVLAKSQNMRDKGLIGAMMSFMNEPTQILSMMTDAVLKVSEAKGSEQKTVASKYLMRTTSAVLTSILITALGKSILQAGRDDDDDKTMFEKFLSRYSGNVFDDVQILNYLPYLKEIMSIWDGYTVERNDVSMLSDLVAGFKALSNDNLTLDEKIRKFAESFSPVVGVPLANIIRGIEQVYGLITGIAADIIDKEFPTAFEMKEAVLSSSHFHGSTKNDYYEKLKKYRESGDDKEFDKLFDYVNGDGNSESVVLSGVKAQYKKDKEVVSETKKYESQLKSNKTYKKLSADDKKDVVDSIQNSLATEKFIGDDLPDYIKLYETKRKSKVLYQKEKDKMIKSGLSEYEINRGEEVAKIKYIKSLGIDLKTYMLFKEAKSVDYADENNSGTVTKGEKIKAAQSIDSSKKTVNALVKAIQNNTIS